MCLKVERRRVLPMGRQVRGHFVSFRPLTVDGAGSGKTYTMMGNPSVGHLGLYVLAARDIFQIVQRPEYHHLSVRIPRTTLCCT